MPPKKNKDGKVRSSAVAAPVVGSKKAASTAEAADEKKPAKKVAKKEAIPTGPHPLHGKTVVFMGTFKVKKNLHVVAVTNYGGKTTGDVSSKTDYVVAGKNPGDKVKLAAYRGIPVWTEDQFNAVCKDGWSGVPPPKPVPALLQCLVDTDRLEESYRKAMISSLTYHLEEIVPNHPHKYLHFTRVMPAKGRALRVGEFGADLIAPIITGCPCYSLSLCNSDLSDEDAKVVMDAIAARGDDVIPMTDVGMSGCPAITDKGANAIAEVLPKTHLSKLSLLGSGLSKLGVTALLNAVEKTPSMEVLDLLCVSGAAEAYKEWKAGSGKNCNCMIEHNE